MTPILGIIASSTTAARLGDYESIATVTVGSGGAAGATFSSIPATYQHLQIRGIMRANRGGQEDSVRLQFNSATGTVYDYHLLYGTGSSAVSGDGISQNFIYPVVTTAASDAANTFAVMVVDILDYANTNKNTTVRSLAGYDENGAGLAWFASGLWRNTAAVNEIYISPGSSSWVQYSSFALYGIK
jgi:hypothetical protein